MLRDLGKVNVEDVVLNRAVREDSGRMPVCVGVCSLRVLVGTGLSQLWERGNLYFCNKVITDALSQGA